ncbi:hypothetical protein OPT61_g1819 [Boeremia exigua]|uniref:Uncharacterized protein n=1 Tax=Boeremia exigua TaxID=749465 RepID=A0ACC2INY2_9PLEO|nr:hypothetical protein OPT61_g1819 [Boeremia exigua]
MHRFALPLLVPLASAAVHTVQVGSSGLSFVPQTISAVEGDTVIFELFAAHDVVTGDFDSPCQTDDDDDDFFSGPYSDTNNGARKFVVNVTTNDPIYYYCSVQRHCQSGMVGGINIPNSGSETIQAYRQAAANVQQQAETPNQLRGGQLLDDAQIASLTSSAGSASASASASGSSAASGSATSTPSGSGSASQSASAATASATGGASAMSSGQVSGVAAVVLGVVAWFM